MRSSFLVICTLLYFGCSQKENRADRKDLEGTDFYDTYSLKESGSATFVLDEKSTFRSGSLNCTQIDSVEYYSFLNAVDNSINLYKLSSQEIFKKAKFEIEGPNGVGRLDLVQHLVISMDSIFIYS